MNLRLGFRHLLGLLFLFPLTAAAQAAHNDGGADISSVPAPAGKPYIYKESGGEPRTMEIYFPPNWNPKNKVPGVILFHGGGWTTGNLKQFRYQCHYLASRGLVAATADYQMIPRADQAAMKPPGSYVRVCITDAKSAIRWMKQHAAELGVDPDRIIVGGGSAGGHLAVLATINPGLNDPTDPKGIDTKVVAYLLFNPGFNKEGPNTQDDEVLVEKQLKGPIAPAIFFHGTKDPLLPRSEAVIGQLKALGDKDVELWIAQGPGHGFFNAEPWADITLAQADRFLVQHGLLKGAETLPPTPPGKQMVRAP